MTIGDSGSGTPPGWYPDGPGWERRWDGSQWTAERRPVPPPLAPPLGPPPAGPPPGWAPGGPSYPPSRRKSRVGLWVALGVVVVVLVATAATLVVVQPWSDDGDQDAGGEPSSEATEATGTGGPTGSTDAPVDGPVRGDLDGDGRGDVVGRYYDETENRLTLTNADGSFESAMVPVQEEEQLVVADFDGDGGNDIASWFDADGALQLDVEDSEIGQTQEFDLWFKVEAIKAAFGDFDGDGLIDVAAYGQQHRSQVAVWVMRNTGAGFDEPVKWAALPNASYGSTELIAGDFNGDGSDDLMAVVPDQPLVRGDFDDLYWYGDFGVVPLTASAGTFRRGGISPVEVDLYDEEYAVGDFDGDGTDTLVANDLYTASLVSYDFDGTTLRPTGESLDYSVAGEGLLDGVVAVDLDGDRLDDLVFTVVDVDDYTFSGAWVALTDAEAGGTDAPVKWADLPDCSGDYCDVEFFPAG